MARYADDAKERVRDAIDMVDVVSQKTELRRSSPNRFEGLCPFHDERTPSFGIDPFKKVYYCFGCQAGGDVFDFVMKTEGLDFIAALESLAGRAGIELEVVDEDPAAQARRARRERLLGLLERTATFYERTLWQSGEAAGAREYLAERGLTEETLRAFRVGYAPSAWDRVTLASRQAGYSADELHACGLAVRSKKGDGVYDRFRRRILFPLCDRGGHVRGFGGRALGADQQPKYLNSSENEVFHKGRQLFAIDLARPHAAKAQSVILAEGYMDVLMLHQAELPTAVGVMGTSLTDEQVEELVRLVGAKGRVEMALDADAAGQRAMLRAAKMAEQRGLDVRVVPLEPGLDPADLVARDGAAAMQARVAASVPFVTFHVERILAGAEGGTVEQRDAALDALREVLADEPPSVRRSELERQIAGRLDIPESLVATLAAAAPAGARAGGRDAGGGGRAAAGGGDRYGSRSASGDRYGAAPDAGASRGGADLSGGGERHAPDGSGGARAVLGRREESERTFLALCVALPGPGAEALAAVDLDAHFTSALARRAAAHLREHLADPLAGVADGDDDLRSLLIELTVRAEREPVEPIALEVEALQLELARLDREIAAAQAAGDPAASRLAVERAAVRERLHAAMDRAVETARSDS